jgi:pantoate kinase
VTAHAFAPGHVTGLFAVHDESSDLLAKGSRGAGWSLELGAHAAVNRADKTIIRLNGQVDEASVTRDALSRLAPDQKFAVSLRLDLPVQQGFGMSAAGTLAACLAATHLLGLEPETALAAAHAAEVQAGTGLGDAIGSWFGGGEIRIKPGCPPHGWAMRVDAPADAHFLFCVLGSGIKTPSIIRDECWKQRTREFGDPAVDRILAAGRAGMKAWTMILSESRQFSHNLGLMPEGMQALGESLPPSVQWGQSMLGNTLWVTGPRHLLDQVRPRLATAGRVLESRVDASGARLVRRPSSKPTA